MDSKLHQLQKSIWSDKYFCKLALLDHLRECLEKDNYLKATDTPKNSFQNCDLSVGLESGLMIVPYTKSGFMDICACAIFDGKEFYLGLSSAFEYPQKVIDLVNNEGLNISEAFFKSGLTQNSNIGSAEGAIGYLTKGRLPRKEYTKQAITTALIHLENKFNTN